jgi:hypothetical protein
MLAAEDGNKKWQQKVAICRSLQYKLAMQINGR